MMEESVDLGEITPEELAEARRYAVEITWDARDRIFVVTVPDLPGVMTHGATREEAATMGDEVIATFIAAQRYDRLPVPSPVTAREVTVTAPPSYGAGGVHKIRRRLGFSQAAFAALLGVSPKTVAAWEQGTRKPDGASRRLLAIAETHPQTLLASASPKAGRPLHQGRGAKRTSAEMKATAPAGESGLSMES